MHSMNFKKIEASPLLKYFSFSVHTKRLEFFNPTRDLSLSRIASLLQFIFIIAYNFGKLTVFYHHVFLGEWNVSFTCVMKKLSTKHRCLVESFFHYTTIPNPLITI